MKTINRSPRALAAERPKRSADQLDQFNSYAEVHRIAPCPLLMIVGSAAETLPFSQGAVDKAGDTADLFLIDGVTHVELYDRGPPVTCS